MGVILLVSLLVNAHLEVLTLGAEHLELGQQRSSVASLGISKLLGVLQLGGQGYLVLAEVADGVLSLLNLPGQILGLHLQLLPGGVSLIEGSSMLIQLGVGLNNESLRHLAVPLHVGTLPHGLIETSTGIHQITLHGGLVLLGLGLVLVERVNVLAHLAHGVVVLGPHGGQGALVLDVGLLLLRESMFSPISPMVLLCLDLMAARVPSCWMLASSSSTFSLASSASRFLFSSIW